MGKLCLSALADSGLALVRWVNSKEIIFQLSGGWIVLELYTSLILKPEPGPSPKSQDRTRPLVRLLFLKPNLGLEAKFTEWIKICANTGYWRRSKVNMTK